MPHSTGRPGVPTIPDRGRRRLLGGFARIGAAAAALPCCIAQHVFAAPPAIRLAQVVDGVFAVQGVHEPMTAGNHGAIANLAAVVGRDAVAVVDSGGSIVEADAFLAAIRQVTDRPVLYLVCTHMHPDHIFGNASFRNARATIVGHHNLPRALAARGDFYLQSYRGQLGEELMRGVEIVAPTLLVEDRLDLDLGGRVLELRAWRPAHTDNDLSVYDPATRTLLAGDLVFIGHLPTLDGSLLGWMEQIEALAGIDAQRVVPGHGPITAAWPDALASERRYFETLAADLRRAIAAGVPLGEAVADAAQAERSNWALFDEYNPRNATAAYAELEWE